LAVTCVDFLDLQPSTADSKTRSFLVSGAPDGECRLTSINQPGLIFDLTSYSLLVFNSFFDLLLPGGGDLWKLIAIIIVLVSVLLAIIMRA